MQTVHITRAAPIGKEQPQAVTIVIDGEPDDRMTIPEFIEFYEDQSDRLVDALWFSLPHATRERLIGKLLLKEAGCYKGIFHGWKPEQEEK